MPDLYTVHASSGELQGFIHHSSSTGLVVMSEKNPSDGLLHTCLVSSAMDRRTLVDLLESDCPPIEVVKLGPVISDSGALRKLSQSSLERACLVDYDQVLTAFRNLPSSQAPSDYVLYLDWVNGVLETTEAPNIEPLVKLQADLLRKAVTISRRHLENSALRHTRASLRKAASKRPLSTWSDLLVVAQLAEALAGLPRESELKDHIDKWLENYSKEVLQAKKLDSSFVHALSPMFELVEQAQFEKFVPALQRSVLRSPETILPEVLPSILERVKALNITSLANALSPSLKSSLSSSNEKTRHAAQRVWRKIIQKCPSETDKVLPLLSQRKEAALAAYILEDGEPSDKLADALATAASKEVTEAGIVPFTHALGRLLPRDRAVQAFKTGLNSRPPLRREWAYALLSVAETPEELKKILRSVHDQIVSSPIAASGLGASFAAELLGAAEPSVALYKEYEHLVPEDYDVAALAAAKTLRHTGDPYALPLLAHVASTGPIKSQLSTRKLLSEVISTHPSSLGCPLVDIAKKVKNPKALMGAFAGSPEAIPRVCVLAHACQCDWIRLCLQSGLDPGDVVRKNYEDIIEESLASKVFNALTTIAFVAPDVVPKAIVARLSPDLKPLEVPKEKVEQVKPKKSQNSKSLEDWDAQVRAEIAKKHAAESKNSNNDTVEIAGLEPQRHACAALTTLSLAQANGTDTGAVVWFPEAVRLLLEASRSPMGQMASDCLQGMARNVARFGSNFQFLLSKVILASKPTEQVVRLLYRAKSLADQTPLDSVSLAYLLPILRNGIANPDHEEAFLLALDIVATEAEQLAEIPRGDLISSLLDLLGTQGVRDCLSRVAQGVYFEEYELQAMLQTTIGPNEYARSTTLEIIDAEVVLTEFRPQIWIARFSSDNAEVASSIWEESRMELPTNALDSLEPFFDCDVREWVGKAYAVAALSLNPDRNIEPTIDRLFNIWNEHREAPKVVDEFGLEIRGTRIDPWKVRSGVLCALQSLQSHSSNPIRLAKFVVDAVRDKNSNIAAQALEFGKTLISSHHATDGLLSALATDDTLPAHVILYGSAAQFLPQGDARVQEAVDRLVANLGSDNLELSVASCLAPLAKKIDTSDVADVLLRNVLQGERGAAWGLAGLVKGLGLTAIGDFGIAQTIQAGVEDKQVPAREGAQLLIGALAHTLGKIFEPYALEFMHLVLHGLGDHQINVRNAANAAARAVMQHTTQLGVKKLIPLALDRMGDRQWRAKKGAVELLGTMAYLGPRQLATSLQVVVPELGQALGDTHKEVRSAAKAALRSFGDVIENPEIKACVQPLLEAISDPPAKTEAALDSLLKTRFVHFVDSPSLALVVPVLLRGMEMRGRAGARRKACRVVGSMSILTTQNDLVPYLPRLLPDLREAMIDPVPATSATASKALGVLVEKLGEAHFPTVIPDLLAALKDPSRSADRMGSAQGLAEVLHGLGTSRLTEVMPELLAGWTSRQVHVRLGFAPLLLMLPTVFGPQLTPFFGDLVDPIVSGLGDSDTNVRETSLKAGRRLVRNYATKSRDVLLPQLESGLGDRNWRLRLGSVELVGDLLLQLAGQGREDTVNIAEAAPGDAEEAEEAADAAADAAVQREEEEDTEDQSNVPEAAAAAEFPHRDRVLSMLFICRADVVSAVRHAAVETWMSIVQNTPRTVRSILSTLVRTLVRRLSDSDPETRENAARALAELVRRVAGALDAVLPTLESLASDPAAREGVCLGLAALVPSTPMDVLQSYSDRVTRLVRSCLTDRNSGIREAASRALEALHNALGDDVAGDLLPSLVEQTCSGDKGALAALEEMLNTAPQTFGMVVPTLLRTGDVGMTEERAAAIATLAEVAGPDEVRQHAERIVDALMPFTDQLDAVLAVEAPQSHLLTIARSDSTKRPVILARMAILYSKGHVDFVYTADWLHTAILALEEPLAEAQAFIEAVIASLPKEELSKLVQPGYRALHMTNTPLAGLHTSVKFMLPLFVSGLTADREAAALALADIVVKSSPEALRSCVTQLTGPLIRVVGERASPEARAAILGTLGTLLNRIPMLLRPFLPQLQRTFVKSLADTSPEVRQQATAAMAELIPLQPRADALSKELISGVEGTDDVGIRLSMLTSLHTLVVKSGDKLSEQQKEKAADLAASINGSPKEIALAARIAAATGSAGATDSANVELPQVLAANAKLVDAPESARETAGNLLATLSQGSMSETSTIAENGVVGLAKYILTPNMPDVSDALHALVKVVPKSDTRSNDARRLAILALGAAADADPAVLDPFLDELVPPLFGAVRETSLPVKLAAERTFYCVFDFGRQATTRFDAWMERFGPKLEPQTLQRSIPEYVRRVALRRSPPPEDLDELWVVGI